MSTNIQNPYSGSGGSGVSNPVTVAQGGTGQTTANAGFAALAPMTTAGDLLIENATPVPARLAIGTVNETLGISGSSLPAWQPALTQQAATVVGGYTMINGTGTIISWTTPNDSGLHVSFVFLYMNVSSATTGGNLNLLWTDPGGSAQNQVILSGTQGGGPHASTQPGYCIIPVGANQTVSIQQSSAMTAGAAKVWAEIWGY